MEKQKHTETAEASLEKQQKKLKNRKKLKYGGLATAITVIFVAVVVLVNVVVTQIGKRYPDFKLDLTTANLYAISDGTLDYIRNMDKYHIYLHILPCIPYIICPPYFQLLIPYNCKSIYIIPNLKFLCSWNLSIRYSWYIFHCRNFSCCFVHMKICKRTCIRAIREYIFLFCFRCQFPIKRILILTHII